MSDVGILIRELARERAIKAELLAACEAMLRHIDDVGDNEDLAVCRERLVSAIRKAKGV